MSKRLDVLTAVKSMIAKALPGADVKGLKASEAVPNHPGPGGDVMMSAGDPGDPSVDLNPPRYYFEHQIPVRIVAYRSAVESEAIIIDRMMGAIGRAIAADQTLGGLCDHLEALAPGTDDIRVDGAAPAGGADLVLVAHYSTLDPLN